VRFIDVRTAARRGQAQQQGIEFHADLLQQLAATRLREAR